MRKHGIVLKLFIATSGLIAIIFMLIMLAQGLFFERYYREFKVNELKQSMIQLSKQYGKGDASEREVSYLLGQFSNETSASIAILDEQMNRIRINPYFIELQTPTKLVTIRLQIEAMSMKDIPQGLHIGESLTVDGIFMDQQSTILSPVKFQSQQSELVEGLVRVEGKIVEMMLPEQHSYNPYYQDTLLNDALWDWMIRADQDESHMQNGEPIQSEWMDPWSGVKYVVVTMPFSNVEQNGGYLFALTSLQPVGEAVVILDKYMIYLAFPILLLVMFLSFVFSRIVSKPLLTLNHTATRMAQLDFTVPADIHSKDEFGELSQSMNTMARNLDTALQELTVANAKLQDDMVEKQRLEQLRKELIANISHELKTPLGIVKGFTEGLQDDVAEEKRERYLSLILNEVDRMNALIMEMLELSKFEAKAIRLAPQTIELPMLVQKVYTSFALQLESKLLQVQINGEASVVVSADPKWIEQVIVNLLSNAIRHAVEQSVIGINIYETGSGQMMICIENEGSSIDEEDMQRIWDQFYRVERSRDRKLGGTGLGLAMVKHILELHDSDYGVKNTNKGVMFYFTLKKSENIVLDNRS
ncbi:HAMP domain-containing protein [Paenibacillus agilis]|uniref:histidine kinase n=2 Tax=Paenibacillus agilis TaxID=3020863 RepID=A0A559J156_9BACL|nr:HAMP domain-containing protein [Paenibacillus agilis]